MNGTYRIPIPAGCDYTTHPKVVKILSMLDPGAKYTISVHDLPLTIKQGEYNYGQYHERTVEHMQHVVIRASGGKAKRKAPLKAATAAPPTPTVEQLTRRLQEAESAYRGHLKCLRSNLHSQWAEMRVPYGWRKSYRLDLDREARINKVGHALAYVASNHGGGTNFSPTADDYKYLDACGLFGVKAPRLSKLRTYLADKGYFGALAYIYGDARNLDRCKSMRAVAVSGPEARSTYVQACQLARMELDYLTELLSLARGMQVTHPCGALGATA